MFDVYLIILPKNYLNRVIAFKDLDHANELCKALNNARGGSSSASTDIKVLHIDVMEREDFRTLKDE